MSVILNIEASAGACSVAIGNDGEIVFNRVNSEERSHAQVLAPFVEEALSHAKERSLTVEAVALSCGPGSYTSLRIASSTAKGVCYGKGIPLIAIPTPKIMSVPVLFRDDLDENALLCPMIDARRDEVYATVYDRALNVCMETRAEILTENTFREFLDERPVVFFGDGAKKASSLIRHENACFMTEYEYPLAKWMMPLAERAFLDEKFEDIAYFEPFYLKNFVAVKSRNLLKDY